MHTTVEASNQLLRKLGYRLTPQRSMILHVLTQANEAKQLMRESEKRCQLSAPVSVSKEESKERRGVGCRKCAPEC